MKGSSIFTFIFIAFFITFGYGEDEYEILAASGASPTETTIDSDATTIAATAGITVDVTTGAPGSPTDNSATGNPTTDNSNTVGPTEIPASPGTGETEAPQSTVPSGNTAAPPTTAAPAPTCPTPSIFPVKDDGNPTVWDQSIPAGVNCTYFARSSSFSKSIVITKGDAFSLNGLKLKITDNNGDLIYDSVDGMLDTIQSNSSQVIINVDTLSGTGEAKASLKFTLEEDQCDGNPCNTGTCSVIQGQETCTCPECSIGARCEITIDPCATYQLVCQAQGKVCTLDSGCKAKCTP